MSKRSLRHCNHLRSLRQIPRHHGKGIGSVVVQVFRREREGRQLVHGFAVIHVTAPAIAEVERANGRCVLFDARQLRHIGRCFLFCLSQLHWVIMIIDSFIGCGKEIDVYNISKSPFYLGIFRDLIMSILLFNLIMFAKMIKLRLTSGIIDDIIIIEKIAMRGIYA